MLIEHLTPWIEVGCEQDEDWREKEEELKKFGKYFLQTWMEKNNGMAALYPPKTWNQYETLLDDGVQTNNALESSNRTWNRLAGVHPNVWHVQV